MALPESAVIAYTVSKVSAAANATHGSTCSLTAPIRHFPSIVTSCANQIASTITSAANNIASTATQGAHKIASAARNLPYPKI